MRVTLRLSLLVCLMALFSQSLANADIIVSNTFPVQTNGDSPYSIGQVVDADVTSLGVERGGYTPNGGGFVGGDSSLIAGDYRTTVNPGTNSLVTFTRFYGFDITPINGAVINFTDFQFVGEVGLADGSTVAPDKFELRSSLDSFGSEIPGALLTGSTVDLSGAQFQGISSPIEFRLFIQDSTGTADPNSVYRLDSFVFNGTVVSAVPEPGSLALLGVLSLGFVARRRKV